MSEDKVRLSVIGPAEAPNVSVALGLRVGDVVRVESIQTVRHVFDHFYVCVEFARSGDATELPRLRQRVTELEAALASRRPEIHALIRNGEMRAFSVDSTDASVCIHGEDGKHSEVRLNSGHDFFSWVSCGAVRAEDLSGKSAASPDEAGRRYADVCCHSRRMRAFCGYCWVEAMKRTPYVHAGGSCQWITLGTATVSSDDIRNLLPESFKKHLAVDCRYATHAQAITGAAMAAEKAYGHGWRPWQRQPAVSTSSASQRCCCTKCGRMTVELLCGSCWLELERRRPSLCSQPWRRCYWRDTSLSCGKLADILPHDVCRFLEDFAFASLGPDYSLFTYDNTASAMCAAAQAAEKAYGDGWRPTQKRK